MEQATTSIELALMAAESLATHGIVESKDFERMMELLSDAMAAVSDARAGTASPVTIFPSRAAAEAFIERHPLEAGTLYNALQTETGRWSIGVFRLARHL